MKKQSAKREQNEIYLSTSLAEFEHYLQEQGVANPKAIKPPYRGWLEQSHFGLHRRYRFIWFYAERDYSMYEVEGHMLSFDEHHIHIKYHAKLRWKIFILKASIKTILYVGIIVAVSWSTIFIKENLTLTEQLTQLWWFWGILLLNYVFPLLNTLVVKRDVQRVILREWTAKFPNRNEVIAE